MELYGVLSTELSSHFGKCSPILVDKHRSVQPMYLLPQIHLLTVNAWLYLIRFPMYVLQSAWELLRKSFGKIRSKRLDSSVALYWCFLRSCELQVSFERHAVSFVCTLVVIKIVSSQILKPYASADFLSQFMFVNYRCWRGITQHSNQQLIVRTVICIRFGFVSYIIELSAKKRDHFSVFYRRSSM